MSILRIKNIDVYFDTDDLDMINQYKWHVEHGRVLWCSNNPKKCIYLSRLLVGAKNGQSVAFKDGDCFNLRKENLELREHR